MEYRFCHQSTLIELPICEDTQLPILEPLVTVIWDKPDVYIAFRQRYVVSGMGKSRVNFHNLSQCFHC